MTTHVHCIAEFLPKKHHEEELFKLLNELAAKTLKNEPNCLRYIVTKQLSHPGAPGRSKYSIVNIEEFVDQAAFDEHCAAEYVADFVKKHVEPKDTALIEDFCVRLFS